jgi:hypothetical protein
MSIERGCATRVRVGVILHFSQASISRRCQLILQQIKRDYDSDVTRSYWFPSATIPIAWRGVIGRFCFQTLSLWNVGFQSVQLHIHLQHLDKKTNRTLSSLPVSDLITILLRLIPTHRNVNTRSSRKGNIIHRPNKSPPKTLLHPNIHPQTTTPTNPHPHHHQRTPRRVRESPPTEHASGKPEGRVQV